MMSLRTPPKPAADREDADLLAQVAAGNLEALGPIFDRHYGAVLRFAARVVGSRGSDAEDIVQEAFLIAARNAASFDGRSSCKPWLFGIVSRIVMQRNRASARLGRFLARLGELGQEPTVAPDALNERRELNQTLLSALGEISPAKRVVLVMAETEDIPCEEIARALAIPIGTVWTRLHHARKELRENLRRSMP
jgi:RNA polymerase sigma-70 factor (ECF subfamily)